MLVYRSSSGLNEFSLFSKFGLYIFLEVFNLLFFQGVCFLC